MPKRTTLDLILKKTQKDLVKTKIKQNLAKNFQDFGTLGIFCGAGVVIILVAFQLQHIFTDNALIVQQSLEGASAPTLVAKEATSSVLQEVQHAAASSRQSEQFFNWLGVFLIAVALLAWHRLELSQPRFRIRRIQ